MRIFMRFYAITQTVLISIKLFRELRTVFANDKFNNNLIIAAVRKSM